ncbi:hypothetical protein PVNG_05948 [Plasmodium vivax North Korean]|uniref:VIR protein n=1 Tax=Plasmodium vivax North Korean TaxID=1035514 RepID=A0A0J9TL75_PLAVI|nr:hypothetical protein PVNG_05948 [Plasmodium vivax North Korean]
MVECSHSDNEYHDYKCHSKLKDYFSRKDIFKDNEDNVQNFPQHIIIKNEYTQEQKQIFNKLYQYLGGDGIFFWQDDTECCKYINYWLNTRVQNLLPDLYDNKSFEIFQNIMKFYNEDKNNNKRCISDIKYIEPHELRKMGTLYSLYEKYEILKEKRRTDDTPCNILISMYRTYNDALTLHGNNDDNLFSRLKALKNLIDNILPQHENCKPLIHFKDPDSIKKKENTESEHHTRTHDQKKITQELQSPEEKTTRPEQETTRPETDSPSPPVLKPVPSELQAENSRGTSNTSERNQPLRTSLEQTHSELSENTYVGNLKGQTLKSRLDHSGGLIYSDTLENPFYSENLGSEKLVRNPSDDGFLNKVQGAFSSIAEHVEPAPILGVSGGMGALFLLFKVFQNLKI